MSIGVIVTTYNWVGALHLVLKSLSEQTELADEILVADDGSQEMTKACVQYWQTHSPTPIQHIWQPDEGFRAAAIRNKAILATQTDYIIFIDGDCVPRADFIQAHKILQNKGYFVDGQRILLDKAYTRRAITQRWPLHFWQRLDWWKLYWQGHCNRFIPFLPIPIYRYLNCHRWQGVKGCNMAVWRQDLIKVNGWDETYTGWGLEDSDLVQRLLLAGIQRKSGYYKALVIHLWHPTYSRAHVSKNLVHFKNQQQQQIYLAAQGLRHENP